MNASSTPVQAARRTPPNLPGVALDPELARTLRRLSGRADEAKTKRDLAIIEARKAGASLREIEAATGINYVTVRRLISSYEPGIETNLLKHQAKRDREAEARRHVHTWERWDSMGDYGWTCVTCGAATDEEPT